MARAVEQLRVNPKLRITDIAMDLGFNDSNYFTRCFRQQFGATPKAWREGIARDVSPEDGGDDRAP